MDPGLCFYNQDQFNNWLLETISCTDDCSYMSAPNGPNVVFPATGVNGITTNPTPVTGNAPNHNGNRANHGVCQVAYQGTCANTQVIIKTERGGEWGVAVSSHTWASSITIQARG